MPAWLCTKCDTKYSREYVEKWGTTRASDGMGSQPVCTNLVPSRSAPEAEVREGHRRTGRLIRTEPALELCRGTLTFDARAAAAPTDAADADPIDPGKIIVSR